MLHRRGLLTLIGGGSIAAVTGLTAFPPGLSDPAAPWSRPGQGERDPRRWALSHALLAPNPHNMQPWLADLREPGVITLSLDTARLLPATDPWGRQILIGCGAFLELLAMALRAAGQSPQITLFPAGLPGPRLDARPVARISLTPAPPQTDPLFRHVLARRTNREPYDAARIPAAADLVAIAAAGGDGGISTAFTAEPARVAALRNIIWQGWQREQATPAALRESVDVMRLGDRAIARHRDGIALPGPAMNLFAASGLINREGLLDPQSMFSQQGAALWQTMAETAPAFLWQQGPDNSRNTQIAAGRAYMRLALAATARGLAIHPWSMALQEYPEMADLYAQQQAILGASAVTPVQMLVRIGHAADVSPAPRRGLDALLLEG
jgi:hypothetical protein